MPTYDGDCTIRHDAVNDRLEVTNSDPHIRISPELIAQWREGNHHNDLSLVDDLVTVNASNRRIAYRLTGQMTDRFGASFFTADLVD